MHVELIDTHATSWPHELETLYQRLGGSANATLLPYHFLQAAFPHIGGQVARVVLEEQIVLFVFLFPTIALDHNREAADAGAEKRAHPPVAYLARYHHVVDLPVATLFDWSLEPTPMGAEALTSVSSQLLLFDWEALKTTLAHLLNVAPTAVTLYDPSASHPYNATAQQVGALEIGHPSATEAATIRTLQQSIWGSPPEYLYPVDIHSADFRLGTSLAARVDGEVAGFLFGFYKAGGPLLPSDWHERWQGNLRLESQVMGVLPAQRGLRIGYLLKRIQAEQALSQGIGVIHWTVDPLQYPNAALNFGLLRAVAFTFTPDYYPFRNELNRGPASRFSLTWMIGSARVRAIPLHDARSTVLQLDHHPDIARVNNGREELDFSATAPMMAIEIPANWTQLQQQAPDEALAWRTATDRLFAHYIGSEPGKYVVTDVGVAGERRYLIIQQVTDYLWQRLEETEI